MADSVIKGTTPTPCGCCATDPCGPTVPDGSACSVECVSHESKWTVTGGLSYSFPDTAELSGCSITINPDGTVSGGGTWHKTGTSSDSAAVALFIDGNLVALLQTADETTPGDYSLPSSGFVFSFPQAGVSVAGYGTRLGGRTNFTLGDVSHDNVTGSSCAAFSTPDDPYFGMTHSQTSTYFATCTGLIPGCSYHFTLDLGTEVEEIDFFQPGDGGTERTFSGSVPTGGAAGACTIHRITGGPGGGGGGPPL